MVDRPEVHLDELYREVVMDHHRHPRGRAPLARVDARAHGFNPVCGDDVYLNLALADDRVEGVQIEGRGCAICTASGSMMAELLPGRPIAEAQAAAESFRGLMHGEPLPEDEDLGDLEALQGVQKFAVRVKCAMLPWVTLQDALRAWSSGAASAESSTESEEVRP
jgi:nitrogen fixation protein NifU and related proteins